MRTCQLCGAKSWCPAKDPHLSELPSDVVALGTAPLMECDGCGALAREDIVSESRAPPSLGAMGAPTMPGSGFPAFDPIGSASAMLKGIIPERDPETRVERLVRELIGTDYGSNLSEVDFGRAVVARAHAIEVALKDQEIIDSTAFQAELSSARPRSFGNDFLLPALEVCTNPNGALGLALDCAIAFGALEGQTTNTSLKLSAELESLYWDKVGRLHALVYPQPVAPAQPVGAGG